VVGAKNEELKKSYRISDLAPEHTTIEAVQHVQLSMRFWMEKRIPRV
jgi:hypothetical protein